MTEGGAAASGAAHFVVKSYQVSGSSLLTPDDLAGLFAPHTGTNVSLDEVVKAAGDLHQEFRRIGYPLMSVAVVPDQITNGIVTLNVFQTAVPQVVVAGHTFLSFPEDEVMAGTAKVAAPVAAPINTNPPMKLMAGPATPAQVAAEREALRVKMLELAAQEKDHRVHVVPTPGTTNFFKISNYLVEGNTILSPTEIGATLTNVDGAFGTNVTLDGIRTAVTELQKAYQERGYVTVAVGLPPQKLTNATIKVHVTEGRLVAVNVTGNHYFSSNNVMRALPSLHTNMLLNGPIFQSEVNRANANQDRQIYPVIGPGPDVGTSQLTLKVKDRLPIHGKVDLDNQNSPGTPDLRVNASAVANNLWQLEHSFGVQYGFSPEFYKQGSQWDWYDQPLVANYSGFYRMPLGSPEPIDNIIASNPQNFGYNEATRHFQLPPPSGRSELNLYASRATIDTGLQSITTSVENIPGFLSIDQQNLHQDVTINEDIGMRLSFSPINTEDFQSTFSGGLDFKTYHIHSLGTNNFLFAITTFDQHGNPNHVNSIDASPNPTTDSGLEYLPLSVRYDGSWRTSPASFGFGMGITGNPWYNSSTVTSSGGKNSYLYGVNSVRAITSMNSSGYWFAVTPSASIDFLMPEQWQLSLRANGQWANERLLSTEQFGIGGVASVRGYHEGEIFGDTGWRFSMEQFTPPHVVGMIHGHDALTIRGSAYMDCATAYTLDAGALPDKTQLWSTGVGVTTSVGSFWEARFLFSLPLLSTATTERDQPYFNFALTAQF